MNALPREHRYALSAALDARARELSPGGGPKPRRVDRFGPPDRFPAYLERGRGSHVWDLDGNEYIDWVLALGPVTLGYCNPVVDAAVKRQIDDGFMFTMSHPTQVALAEKLTRVIPGAELVYFLKSGSEATTAAIRIARAHTGRQTILRWGFHGWHGWANPDPGVPEADSRDVLAFPFNDLDALETLLHRHAGQVAAVILMPLEDEPPQPGFFQDVRRLAHAHDTLLIFDEVRTGFRLALGGAQEHYGVTADLNCLSKAMGNGYPISAVTGQRDILMAVERTTIGGTFNVDALGMVAALATIGELSKPGVYEHLWATGRALQAGLAEVATAADVEIEVRGLPVMPFMRFREADQARRQAMQAAFYAEVFAQGVFLHPLRHWFSCVAHTDDDVRRTIEACGQAFAAARRAADAPALARA